MEYGLQMYSVRDITQDDLPGAIAKVAQLGYKLIEFAGFFGHSAEEVNQMLADNGVVVSGTHTGLGELLNDYEGTLAFHKAIHNPIYIIPGHDLSTKEKLDQFIDDVNRLQPLLKAEGIEMGFHNHSGEFLPNKDGIIVYDELVARTGLRLEIDTFWAYAAGKDPVALMEQLKDRLRFIHIKDGFQNGEGKPLGQGTAPVAAVYAKAIELGVPMVVESETLTPDGLTEAKICFEYLKGQE
ncbi:MAG: sugar phosphate isomerase/epimerase [Clostridia bacterium]|nr:sugar phosphate isomerase/epimerase [Clostridia bacterium]